MNSSRQIKIGAIVSYFTLAFNMISGLLYTPWLIERVGQSDYGLYTAATSFISLFVLDFGMGGAVARFIAKYNAEGKQKEANDFLGAAYKLYLIFDAVILSVLVLISFFIETIYSKNLSASEFETFKILYVIVGFFTVFSFPFTHLGGVLSAYERFVELKLADLFHKVFIVVAMIISLSLGAGVYALVMVNGISAILTILIKLILIKAKTPMRANFKIKIKEHFKDIFSFSFWATVSMLAQRLILNITPSIIVAVSVTGAIGSSIFGVASTIENYIFLFSNAINGMFMHRISKLLYEGKKNTELVDLIVKVGRIQCFIVGILLVGFISFGKSFIVDIWNKPDFVQSYICIILLTIPNYFFLPMEIANTTLLAENKVKYQAIVFIISGVVNVIISIFASKYWGAIGASVSIFVAYMVRNIVMVIIHIKVLHLDMKRLFKEAYLKITPFLLLMTGVGLAFENFNPIANEYLRFFINGCAFVAIFAVIAFLFVFNSYEKKTVLSMADKIIKKIKK